ncbi:MAG TPA: LAGLIDADG family homing endonuclease [Kofleriaceae bacterium]|jgi:hypothetical protein
MERLVERIGKRLNPWWVTGLVDGEGSFTYQTSTTGQVMVVFALKLTQADSAVVWRVQDFFAAGRIYTTKARVPSKQGEGWTKTATYFRVIRKAELPRIVDHFEVYPLQSKKQEAFAIWKEMVALQCAQGSRADGLGRLSIQLSSAQVRNKPWA